jgi:phosphate transport system substrate-binding protein
VYKIRFRRKILKNFILVMVFTFVLFGCTRREDGDFNAKTAITVISREEGSGTRGAFIELFDIEQKDAAGRKDLTTKEAVVARQTDVVMTNVSGNKYAIGYISLGSLNDSIKSVMINNAVPNTENVLNGSYSVVRPFYLAAASNLSSAAEDFINFILCEEGQQIVAKNYIRINENAAPYEKKIISGKIVVAGSSSVTPVMEKLREEYIKIQPDITVEIQQSDTSTGLNAVLNGSCDIAMASRELKENEMERLTPVKIALDGIAVIINKNNPLENLDKEDVKKIWIGNVSAWNEVLK